MLYPSLHIITVLMYYLFRTRSCDCGCGQNCGNTNNVVRFCRDCSDPERCRSECVSDPVTPHNSRIISPEKNGTQRDNPVTPPKPSTDGWRRNNKRTKIIVGVVTVSITAGFSIPLITRAFFVPPMPNFALPGVTINSFDISTPNVIRANFQVYVSSRNSNNLFRFYFDRLRVYVTYRNQQITYSTPLPPNHEGHNQTDAWTANVFGKSVTLEPNNAIALCQEQATGCVRVTIRIVGRVRWKFWFFPTVKHRFSVSCSASIPLASQQTHIMVRKCSVRL